MVITSVNVQNAIISGKKGSDNIHFYLKEQECNTVIPHSIHKNRTKQVCYKMDEAL